MLREQRIFALHVLHYQKERRNVMNKTYNFSAGPAVLPKEVLQEAANEMLNYNDCGMSAMEISYTAR